MSGEDPRWSREGIAKTARDMREGAARNGHQMTQQQAERKVREAVRRQNQIARESR